MAGLDQNVVDLLRNAPELQQTPDLSYGLAQGSLNLPGLDPAALGQSASFALMGSGVKQADQEAAAVSTQPEHHSFFSDVGSFFGHAAHDVEHVAVHDVIDPVSHVMSAGLNEVQHTYRYIHDVWERHGVLAALGEIALIGAGVAAGIALAPEALVGGAIIGGVLGGEVAGDVAARLPVNHVVGYQDSWNATNNGGMYRDQQGWHVSPGRDFARLLGYVTGSPVTHNAAGNVSGGLGGLANDVSGLTDFTFDVSLDPTIKLGQLYKAAQIARIRPSTFKSWEDVKGGDALSSRAPIVDTEGNPVAIRKTAMDPDGIMPNDVQVIFQRNAAVQDAFRGISAMSTAEVVRNYPALRPLAGALGKATTPQEVADTFEMALTTRNYSFAKYGLPHTSLTRRLLGQANINLPTPAGVGYGLQDRYNRVATKPDGSPLVSSVTGMPVMIPNGARGHIVNAFTSYAPFAFNSKTLAISGHQGDPMDPEFLRGFYSVLRYSQNAATSQNVLAKYIETPDLGERVNIIVNAYRDALRASGLPDTSPFVGKVTGDLNFLTRQAMGRIYAVDKEGRALRMFDDEGNAINRGVFINQTGQIAFPNFNDWRQAVADAKGGVWSQTAKIDHWVNQQITTRYFKRLVLLSLGFAFRVSAGELIPAMFATDARSMVSGGLAAASAKLNPDVSEIFDQLPREAGNHPLIGARVGVRGLPYPGTLKDFDASAGEATVNTADGEHLVPFKDLTVYHKDIADEEIRQIVKDYGAQVSTDELPHIRAAVGKALWGVGKAIGDPTYRQVALLNVIANNGHIVAPGIASLHDLPRGMEGIHKDTREAAMRAGVNIKKGDALGTDFRLWDSGDSNHPMFWNFALREGAADPGIRAMARAYADTLHITEGHDLEGLASQIREGGATYDLREHGYKSDGYAFAAHPGHESRIPLAEFRKEHIQQYMDAKASELAKPGNHLGAWTEDGHVVFDVSKVTDDEAEAAQLASKRGEKAYGDLAAYARGEDGTHNLEYASEKERLRNRRRFAAQNPIGSGAVRFSPVVPTDGLDAGGSRPAGSGASGSGEAAGGVGTNQVRRIGESHEQVATEAAIKADRLWFESPDPQAITARTEMAHYSRDPEKYSAIRADALKGLVHGQDNRVNMDVLDALGHGDVPSMVDLHNRPYLAKPSAVKGRTLDPIPELGTFSRVVNGGWRPLHGIINSLSRAPIWTNIVTDEYKMLKPWVDSGYMTMAEAHGIAQVRGLNRMLPLIHNTMLRNKFSLVTSNIYPFYFAMEQAYKRYGRAMFTNPKGFREAELLAHGLHSSGALQSDGNGNKYLVLPGIGHMPFLATLALGNMGVNVLGGVPGTISGDTISLRSVVPEMNVGPSVSPLVAIPLKEIADKFPQTDPFVAKILGPVSANATISQELIPNAFARRVWEAVDPNEASRAFASTFAMNAAWSAHKALPLWEQAEKIDPRSMDTTIPRNQLDPRAAKLMAQADRFMALPNATAHDKQVSMDRLRNTTRVQLIMKAMVGMISPLAPAMSVGDVQFHAELQQLMTKYGVTEGIQRFMDKYPDATPDTVFQSSNEDTNTNPPATGAALSWIDGNRGWVDKNQLAAAYLIPQTPGGFNSVAYNEELAMHLRQRRSPSDFVDAIYTAEGNAEFIPSLKDYEAQKQAAQGNSAALHQLGTQWQTYMQDLAQRNPIWYENEFSAKKVAVAIQAYQQLQHAVNDPHTPNSPMLGVASELIQSYQDYERQVQQAQSSGGGYSSSQLKTQWYDYLDQVVAANPGAQAMAYGVFRRLVSI